MRNKVRGIILPDFTAYYMQLQQSKQWHWYNKDRRINQGNKIKFRNKPTKVRPTDS